MTLEEKVGQLCQYVPFQDEWFDALSGGLAGSVLNNGGADKTNDMQRIALAGSGKRIPVLVGHDVIHGYKTIFPIPLAIASSWDPQLAELSARIAAREARAAGIRWTFAPMIDIARDARWGRVAEGAGEDPYLGSLMAAAYVRGFQGDFGPESVLATAKHFVAYGAPEGGRDYGPVEMSEGTLREVYLPPYRAASDAGVASIMSAFDSVNGVPASANRRLLTGLLRDEWKFRGFVDSDWAAVEELINHGFAATKQDAAIKALTAGVDIDMFDAVYPTLVRAVRDGKLKESVVDEAVRRVLRAKFAICLFDDPYTDETLASKVWLTKEHRDTARRVAQHSIVLLKNEGSLLPLSKSGTIAVFGALADSKGDMLGSWAGEGRAEDTVSALDGIRNAIGDRARVLFAAGFDDAIARQADVIVAILGETGEMSGEAASRASIDLPGSQEQLLESLVATGKPVALVVMAGRPLSIPWAAAHVPAIVNAWQLGTEGGNALADVLFGDVNPSGRLPITVPRTVGQVPIYYAHLPSGRPADPDDKFTSKYIDLPIGPLYPFGFGLSYTTFAYSNLRVQGMTVSADVRNTGARTGDEVVQFYIRDLVASVSRPVRELKRFARITLAPGETKHVAFQLTRRDLEFWSDRGWIAEPGTFRVWIAPDAEHGLEGTLEWK
ncbi:MAG: glycoside hydrolase family 3 N-terminal domain-containing protein [Thermoanaerobaculia bacterium]